jgi:hypothetical protein
VTDAPLRHDNPARDTWVASLLDPALDRDHPAWPAARDRYARTRAIADLAALPTIPDQWPTLWRLRPLTSVARAAALSSTSTVLQRLSAVRFGVVARIEGPRSYDPARGTVGDCAEVALPTADGAQVPQITAAAVDAQTETHGGLWIDEVGEIILHRTDLPPRRYLPFPLPLPSALL